MTDQPRKGRATASPFLEAKLTTAGIRVELPPYEPVTITENLSWSELVTFFSENFVPFVQCGRKCQASDLCPFTVPDLDRPGTLKEIVCGYQVHALREYLRHTLPRLRPRTRQQMSALIQNSLAMKEFMFTLFTTGAGMADPAYLRYWDSGVPDMTYFSAQNAVAAARALQDSFAGLGLLFLAPAVLFVEGKTEKVVLDTALDIRHNRYLSIVDLKGNARLEFLRASMENAVAQGKTTALLLDKPSPRLLEQVERLIKSGLLKRKNLKYLAGDFEDEFQSSTLEDVARTCLEGASLEAVLEAIADRHGRRSAGFTRVLRSKVARKTLENPIRVEVARIKERMARGISIMIESEYQEFRQLLAWKKGRRPGGKLRLSRFTHLCRWVQSLPGRDVRSAYLERASR